MKRNSPQYDNRASYRQVVLMSVLCVYVYVLQLHLTLTDSYCPPGSTADITAAGLNKRILWKMTECLCLVTKSLYWTSEEVRLCGKNKIKNLSIRSPQLQHVAQRYKMSV